MTSFCPITDNAALRTVVLPDMGCPYRTPMAHPPRMDWIVSKFAPIPTQPSVRTACRKLLLVRSLRADTKFFNAVPSSTSAIIHSCRTIQISKERWLAMNDCFLCKSFWYSSVNQKIKGCEEIWVKWFTLVKRDFWQTKHFECVQIVRYCFFLVPVRCNNCLCLSGRSLLSIERRSVSSRCRHGTYFKIERAHSMELLNTAQKNNYFPFSKFRCGTFGFNPRE